MAHDYLKVYEQLIEAASHRFGEPVPVGSEETVVGV
jgi:hypothetical protein